jgi:hypothetical protein
LVGLEFEVISIMKLIFLIALSLFSVISMATEYPDPVGDVDHSMKGFCTDISTDIIRNKIEESGDDFIVTMTMSRPIALNQFYREYYFWIDTNSGSHKGYRPYLPYSVAWPDMYADFRFFLSLNSDSFTTEDVKKVTIQNCLQTNCENDQGMIAVPKLDVKIEGSQIIFKWPKTLIPELNSAKKWRVGFTTYYSYFQCSGEDDSPQWGKECFHL